MSSKGRFSFWHALSEQNRVYFWSIFSTGLVGFFSLWLGITIQDDINTKNARETQKLARYQMVQAVYPNFSQYIDTGGIVFFDLWEIYNTPSIKKNNTSKAYMLKDYYDENQVDFIEAMKNSVNFMCDNRYYFNRASQRQICTNNTSILFGLKLLERNNVFLYHVIDHWSNCTNLDDSVKNKLCDAYYAKNTFSYREGASKEIVDRCQNLLYNVQKGDSVATIENVLYNFVFLPYIDNFIVYENELLPDDDVSSHIWKHIWILLLCIVLSMCFCVFLIHHVFKTTSNNKNGVGIDDN